MILSCLDIFSYISGCLKVVRKSKLHREKSVATISTCRGKGWVGGKRFQRLDGDRFYVCRRCTGITAPVVAGSIYEYKLMCTIEQGIFLWRITLIRHGWIIRLLWSLGWNHVTILKPQRYIMFNITTEIYLILRSDFNTYMEREDDSCFLRGRICMIGDMQWSRRVVIVIFTLSCMLIYSCT